MKTKALFIIIIFFIAFQKCQGQKYSAENTKYKVYKNLKKALRNKSQVRILRLNSKELKEFPIEILELKELRILSLYENELTEIPDRIDQLKNLERFELMKNKLSSLPKSIVSLKKLIRINVAYNGLYEEDVEFIKKALPHCTVITTIIL